MVTSSKSSNDQASSAKRQLMDIYGKDQAIKDAVVSMVIGMTSPRSNKPLATQKKGKTLPIDK